MIYEIDTIPLHAVRLHADTQSRAAMNQATIDEYAEAIRAGTDFPPVVTYFDGKDFWLADGFHRYFAHKAAGAMEIASELREGSKREAILHSVGANAAHGLRRTNEDKRRAVQTLLTDPEWATWSDNAIAKACSVSHTFVSNMRPVTCNVASEKSTESNVSLAEAQVTTPEERTFTTKHGTTATMSIANIGKASQTDEPALPSLTTDTGNPVSLNACAAADALITSDEVQALREQLAEEVERNTELAASMKETLADNEMMGRVFDADDRIKASMVEANRQKAIAESAERTLASKNGEFVARAAQVTHWMNRAQKAEKALAKLGVAK